MTRAPTTTGPHKVEHSAELAWAAMLAIHLALKRRHRRIQLRDYFAALYLADRRKLSQFWNDEDELDSFVQATCGLTDPPWYYQIQFYRDMIRNKYGDGVIVPCSEKLRAVLNQATKALSGRGKAKSRRTVTTAHVLSAMASRNRTEFAERLVGSGINLKKLQRKLLRG